MDSAAKMNSATAMHLSQWLEAMRAPHERDAILARMLAFLQEYPAVVAEGRSWPEIEALAKRNAAK